MDLREIAERVAVVEVLFTGRLSPQVQAPLLDLSGVKSTRRRAPFIASTVFLDLKDLELTGASRSRSQHRVQATPPIAPRAETTRATDVDRLADQVDGYPRWTEQVRNEVYRFPVVCARFLQLVRGLCYLIQ